MDIEAVPGCQTVKMAKNIQLMLERQPPVTPIKVQLRSPSESTPVQTGQSLFSVLEQITTRPRLKTTVCNRQYKDFQLTSEPESKATEPEVFSSSLSKSLAVLTKFAETEICHNIIDDLVTKIEQRKSFDKKVY